MSYQGGEWRLATWVHATRGEWVFVITCFLTIFFTKNCWWILLCFLCVYDTFSGFILECFGTCRAVFRCGKFFRLCVLGIHSEVKTIRTHRCNKVESRAFWFFREVTSGVGRLCNSLVVVEVGVLLLWNSDQISGDSVFIVIVILRKFYVWMSLPTK